MRAGGEAGSSEGDAPTAQSKQKQRRASRRRGLRQGRPIPQGRRRPDRRPSREPELLPPVRGALRRILDVRGWDQGRPPPRHLRRDSRRRRRLGGSLPRRGREGPGAEGRPAQDEGSTAADRQAQAASERGEVRRARRGVRRDRGGELFVSGQREVEGIARAVRPQVLQDQRGRIDRRRLEGNTHEGLESAPAQARRHRRDGPERSREGRQIPRPRHERIERRGGFGEDEAAVQGRQEGLHRRENSPGRRGCVGIERHRARQRRG
mmetsp:Transcript_33714/g.71860  ORF Transcript_33714/g.71860 Transcript_33714/m.71860 type:complete len:265 (+) Transcript_33714:294-1088(+)